MTGEGFSKRIVEDLKLLPNKPGVYIMKDINDNIIYVGKAISLKKRVSSYFRNSLNQTPKVRAMVSHVDHFEYIIVENEVEALILESNFIKNHSPHYNILLRDDKQYPYIKVTHEKYPRILKVREVVNRENADYFGPYPNATTVNEIIEFLNGYFKLRTCNLNFNKAEYNYKPCLYYYIKKCDAPCINKISEQDYKLNIDRALRFLQGDYKDIKKDIQDKMYEASNNLDFEYAASMRDLLSNIDVLFEKQKVTLANSNDADLIALALGDNFSIVQVFFLRDGKIVDRVFFHIDNTQYSAEKEILKNFIIQFYSSRINIPKEILISCNIQEESSVENFLNFKANKKIKLKVPVRGEKFELMKIVQKNAYEELYKTELKIKSKSLKNKGLIDLEQLLGLIEINRIELYDVSNLYGHHNVGSMVVFNKDKKSPNDYRKFKIKTVDGVDEYGSQKEMLYRRFNRYVDEHLQKEKGQLSQFSSFGKKPDLIIMDGGKGQVNIANNVIANFNLDIPVIGLIKDDKHKTKSILFNNKEIFIKESSSLYRLLYSMQEEVHRFAINYHRKLRQKSVITSQLDSIKGIGTKRRNLLLNYFKDIEKIKNASLDEIIKAGIPKNIAEEVKKYFGNRDE